MSLTWRNKPDESSAPDKLEEIRRMAGHDGSLDRAIEDAPSNSEIAIPSPDTGSRSRARSRKTTTPPPQPSAPILSAEEQLKQKMIADAQKKIGEDMMKDVAAMPYDVWAFLAGDDDLSLSKEEVNELAEAYYLVAQSLSISRMSPLWTGLLYLAGRNARLVKSRMKSLDKLGVNKTLKEVEQAQKN